jgi:hypothetical protein
MIRDSHRVLIALLALTAFVSIARADSVSVSGSCLAACSGSVDVYAGQASVYAYPLYFSGTSGMSDHPEIAAEFQWDVGWVLVFDTATGSFNMASSDGDLRISGRITSFNLTTTPVFHQPLVYFWTATDSVQWIDPAGQTINIPQTGATGSGAIGSTGVNPRGSFDFGFDLPAAPISEPGAFALLIVGLFAVLPWLRRRA